jgi:hypothetical protein
MHSNLSRVPSKGRREKRAQGKAAGPSRGMHAIQQGRNRQNLSSPSVQVCVRAPGHGHARLRHPIKPLDPSTSMHGHKCVHARRQAPAGTYVVCAIVRQRQIYVQAGSTRRLARQSPHRFRSHDSMHVRTYARHARRQVGVLVWFCPGSPGLLLRSD